jgi:drug/metabolite transporter (DMT)-like permease
VTVVLSLAGLILVLTPWRMHGLAAGLLAVAGGLSWAVASVLFKIIRKRHDVEILTFTAWQGLFGSVPLIIAAFATATRGPTWSSSFIAVLVFNFLVASAFAWLLWLYVLHSLPAGVAGISSLAIPVVGVLAAWIQLGERPGTLEAVGVGLIVAALAVLTARGLLNSRAEGDQRTEAKPEG